ncbi:MAG: dephospho-CoA kinase [Hyphomicrobium sp.]|jgi:dephospho-CoA kinase
MIILGLTGSIGMGKSTLAAMFRARGIAVFDADAEVHRLYEGAAVPMIEAAFRGTTARGTDGTARVDRGKLAAALAVDSSGFTRLEAIVHPLVQAEERAFLETQASRAAPIAVLEIPLLYETGLNKKVDAVVVASASPENQRQRVLARGGMTEARLAGLLARQVPDIEKRQRADFVVDTNRSLGECEAAVDAIIEALKGASATAYDHHWR